MRCRCRIIHVFIGSFRSHVFTETNKIIPSFCGLVNEMKQHALQEIDREVNLWRSEMFRAQYLDPNRQSLSMSL